MSKDEKKNPWLRGCLIYGAMVYYSLVSPVKLQLLAYVYNFKNRIFHQWLLVCVAFLCKLMIAILQLRAVIQCDNKTIKRDF